MSHFRRKAPKKVLSHGACYMCKPHRVAGNREEHFRHFKSVVKRDPLYYERRLGKHKVRYEQEEA